MQEALWGLGLVLVIVAVVLYNRLVVLRNRFRNAFAQIDVQLKRRYDLIPNLVDAVKGYMAHERATLEAVSQARARASLVADAASVRPGDAQAMAALAEAEAALGGALGTLLARVEAYPQLKASANVLALQEELSSTENRISFARQHYNSSSADYNTACQKFPNNVLAGMFGFRPQEYFQLESPAEKEVPQVKF